MTENTFQAPAYTPPTLRIAATYPVPQIGDTTAPTPGQPDNVEIELHHPNPGITDGAFIAALVDSLFRNAAPGATPTVTVDSPQPWTATTASGGSITYPPGVRAVTTWNADGEQVA